jgi:hypothetical protein
VDNEKKESSGTKTHKEIMELFDDLETLEQQIKNPDSFEEEPIKTKVVLQPVEPPIRAPMQPREQRQVLEPTGEIPSSLKKKQPHIQFQKQDVDQEADHPSLRSFSFLKKKKGFASDPRLTEEIAHQPMDVQAVRTTFTLDIDSNGNLVGFTLKKQRPAKSTSTAEQPGEEPAKGIKGKLTHLVSRFRRKESSEGGSAGIVEKIKGVLRRKLKE